MVPVSTWKHPPLHSTFVSTPTPQCACTTAPNSHLPPMPVHPTLAVPTQAIADMLGRWSRGGASAERMYRTLTDPGYHKVGGWVGRGSAAASSQATPTCWSTPAGLRPVLL